MGQSSDIEEKVGNEEQQLRVSSMDSGFKYKISVYSVALLNTGGGILRILVPSLDAHQKQKQIIEKVEESLFNIYPYTAFYYQIHFSQQNTPDSSTLKLLLTPVTPISVFFLKQNYRNYKEYHIFLKKNCQIKRLEITQTYSFLHHRFLNKNNNPQSIKHEIQKYFVSLKTVLIDFNNDQNVRLKEQFRYGSILLIKSMKKQESIMAKIDEEFRKKKFLFKMTKFIDLEFQMSAGIYFVSHYEKFAILNEKVKEIYHKGVYFVSLSNFLTVQKKFIAESDQFDKLFQKKFKREPIKYMKQVKVRGKEVDRIIYSFEDTQQKLFGYGYFMHKQKKPLFVKNTHNLIV